MRLIFPLQIPSLCRDVPTIPTTDNRLNLYSRLDFAVKIQAIVRGRNGRNIAAQARNLKWENEPHGFVPQELLEETVANGCASKCYLEETKSEPAIDYEDATMDDIALGEPDSDSDSDCVSDEEEDSRWPKKHIPSKIDHAGSTPEFEELEAKWNPRFRELHKNCSLYGSIDKMKKSDVQEHLADYGLTKTGRLPILRKKLKYITGLDMDYDYDLTQHHRDTRVNLNPRAGGWPLDFDPGYGARANHFKKMSLKIFRNKSDGSGTRSMTRFRNIREMVECYRIRMNMARTIMYKPCVMDVAADYYINRFKREMAKRADHADQRCYDFK